MKKNEEAANKKKPKTSAAQIRVQKGTFLPSCHSIPSVPSIWLLTGEWHGGTDLTELDLPATMQTNFPDPADLLNFTLTITPDEGASLLRSRMHRPLRLV